MYVHSGVQARYVLKTTHGSSLFGLMKLSMNSLTCSLEPPRPNRGSAVTVNPFRERALLTMRDN